MSGDEKTGYLSLPSLRSLDKRVTREQKKKFNFKALFDMLFLDVMGGL